MTLAIILFLTWAYYSLSTAERHYPLAAWITFVILIGQAIAVVGNNVLILITLLCQIKWVAGKITHIVELRI